MPSRWAIEKASEIAYRAADLREPCFEQLISDRRTDRVVLYAYPGWASAGRRLRRGSVTI